MLIHVLLSTAAQADTEVVIEAPMRTRPVSVRTEQQIGGAGWQWAQPVNPDARFALGLGIVSPLKKLGSGGELVLDSGLRGWYAQFEGEHNISATLSEVHSALSIRGSQDAGKDVFLWGGLGAGLQVEVFNMNFWPTHINPGLMGFGTMGLTSRVSERLDWVIESRISTVMRTDYYEGTAEMTDQRFHWRYWPGNLGIYLRTGFRFGSKPDPQFNIEG